jgi:hypothetical protein
MRKHLDGCFADLAALPVAAPAGRNLVLGMTAGYGRAELAPFVESLRGCGYRGDIALVTFDTSAETSAWLRARQVRELSFDSLPLLNMSMNSARMLKYLEFLRTEALDRYNYIMLADVRDIVFQGDPFARVDGAPLYYFLESGRTIGTCPVNAGWMRMAFGEEVLRQTASFPVSCAGTTIGTPRAMLAYLLWMARYIAESAPGVRHSGIDQAIHNYLMATQAIDGAKVMANGGMVMTVPPDERSGITVAADGRLINADGTVSETVHQYDRDPVLLASVRERWR